MTHGDLSLVAALFAAARLGLFGFECMCWAFEFRPDLCGETLPNAGCDDSGCP